MGLIARFVQWSRCTVCGISCSFEGIVNRRSTKPSFILLLSFARQHLSFSFDVVVLRRDIPLGPLLV
jgi:hypothetical protein